MNFHWWIMNPPDNAWNSSWLRASEQGRVVRREASWTQVGFMKFVLFIILELFNTLIDRCHFTWLMQSKKRPFCWSEPILNDANWVHWFWIYAAERQCTLSQVMQQQLNSFWIQSFQFSILLSQLMASDAIPLLPGRGRRMLSTRNQNGTLNTDMFIKHQIKNYFYWITNWRPSARISMWRTMSVSAHHQRTTSAICIRPPADGDLC